MKLAKKLLRRLLQTLGSTKNGPREFNRGDTLRYADVLELTRAVDGADCRFNIPVDRCVWGYGWRYSKEENPYTRFYESEESLGRFYERYCPATIEEAFSSFGSPRHADPSLPLRDPVLTEIWPKASRRHRGLRAAESPHSGPVSRQFLASERERLTHVRNSIQRNGWQPERFGGYIRGVFLVRDGQYLFKVTGGQHRAAALSQLGWSALPAIFQPGYPRVVGDWSFRCATHMDASEPGQKILSYYFDEALRGERRRFLASLQVPSVQSPNVAPSAMASNT